MYIINNQVSENTAFKSRKFFRYIKTKEETANKAISQDDDSIFLSYSNIKSSTGFWSTIISKIKNLFESGRTEAVSYIKDDGKSDKTLDSFKFEKQVILQGRKNHPSDIKETDNITPKKEPNYSSYYEENGNTAHEYGYNDFNTTIKEVKNPNGELIRKEFSDTMGYEVHLYKNGRLAKQEFYEEGEKTPYGIATFDKNEKIEQQITFFSAGKIQSIVQYEDGKIKNLKIYHQNGKIKQQTIFSDNKQINQKIYNEDGKLISEIFEEELNKKRS